MGSLQYFSRYNKIPNNVCKALYNLLSSDDPPYFSLQSEILRNTNDSIDGIYKAHFIKFCEKKWNRLKKIKFAEDYRKSILLWLIKENRMTYRKLTDLFMSNRYDEWVKTRALYYVDINFLGEPSYEALLNKIIRQYDGDLSISACYLLLLKNCKVGPHKGKIKHLPSTGLKEFGMIRTQNSPESEIPRCLRVISKKNLPNFNWKKALGRDHKDIQNKFIINTGYITTDATAWIMSLDVILDNILYQLARHDTSVGSYKLGEIGGFLHKPTSRFAINYPLLCSLTTISHDHRKDADLSHPENRNTGKKTGRIKFKVIKEMQPIIHRGFRELIIKW